MVKDQHEKITGYRDLTEEEITLMNEAKKLAEEVREFIDDQLMVYHSQTGNHAIDTNWLEIARTDLQKGFMSLVRSIARPETF